eukprot:gene1369-biopygen6736
MSEVHGGVLSIMERLYLHGRNASEIRADGQDVALITVELLDAAGVLVPNADLNVEFTVSGPGGSGECRGRVAGVACHFGSPE